MADSCLTDAYGESDGERALREVRQLEGKGRVINDWYSKSEYTKRRHNFLGKQSEYENVPKVQQIAVADADSVFDLEDSTTISAQEVRRRELKYGIFPLLPLPTTSNMSSIDNYGGYPTQEWQPHLGDDFMAFTQVSSISSPLVLPSTAQSDSQTSEMQDNATAAPRTMRQQTSNAALLPNPLFNVASTSTSAAALVEAMDSNESGSLTHPPGLFNGPEQRATIRKVIDDLAKRRSLTKADAPDEYKQRWKEQEGQQDQQRWTPAAALAGSPIRSPIKNKKRTHTDEDDNIPATDDAIERGDSPRPDADAVNQAEEQARPTKKLKPSPDSRPASSQATKRPTRQIKATAKALDASASTANPSSASSSSSTPATTSTNKQARTLVDRVATGDALPTSLKVAQEAQTLRHDRLQAQNDQNSRRIIHHPEFLPEFFSRRRFSPADVASQNVIRCICGSQQVNQNKTINWLGCSTPGCMVWQHAECVGEAAPKNTEKGKHYCHICDPYRHRRNLQTIRKEAAKRGDP